MQETNLVGPAEPFLQGDIVQMVAKNGTNPVPPYGVIINADCDLEHCKVDGVISYIPIFPFEQYFEKFWIPIFADSRRKEIIDYISQKCRLASDANESLCDWLKEEAPEKVAEKIAKTFGVKVSETKDRIKELSLIVNAPQFNWKLMRELALVHGPKPDDLLVRHARRALKNLGDGNFFINEIAGLPSLGFVARMKRVYSVDSTSVFRTHSDFTLAESNSEIAAIRIAKLTNLYRFKIAQIFAHQFSRIGLPDEITSLNETAVDVAVSNLRWGDD